MEKIPIILLTPCAKPPENASKKAHIASAKTVQAIPRDKQARASSTYEENAPTDTYHYIISKQHQIQNQDSEKTNN